MPTARARQARDGRTGAQFRSGKSPGAAGRNRSDDRGNAPSVVEHAVTAHAVVVQESRTVLLFIQEDIGVAKGVTPSGPVGVGGLVTLPAAFDNGIDMFVLQDDPARELVCQLEVEPAPVSTVVRRAQGKGTAVTAFTADVAMGGDPPEIDRGTDDVALTAQFSGNSRPQVISGIADQGDSQQKNGESEPEPPPPDDRSSRLGSRFLRFCFHPFTWLIRHS